MPQHTTGVAGYTYAKSHKKAPFCWGASLNRVRLVTATNSLLQRLLISYIFSASAFVNYNNLVIRGSKFGTNDVIECRSSSVRNVKIVQVCCCLLASLLKTVPSSSTSTQISTEASASHSWVVISCTLPLPKTPCSSFRSRNHLPPLLSLIWRNSPSNIATYGFP